MAFFNNKSGKRKEPRNKPTVQPVISDKKQEKNSLQNSTTQEQNFEQEIEKAVKELDEAQEKEKTFLQDPLLTNGIVHTFVPRTKFKPLVDKKLSIILVENTIKVAKDAHHLISNIKKIVPSGLICIINYGSSVRQSEIFDISSFNESILLLDDIGDEACLYDALVELEALISKKSIIIEEKEKERVRINKIEVIGIGTCTDTCSKASKNTGIDCFCKVTQKHEVSTKCFCITEESFMAAAEIGFRSIGAIIRNY